MANYQMKLSNYQWPNGTPNSSQHKSHHMITSQCMTSYHIALHHITLHCGCRSAPSCRHPKGSQRSTGAKPNQPTDGWKSLLHSRGLHSTNLLPTRKCALTSMSRFCKHRVKLSEPDDWFYLSRSSRDRVSADVTSVGVTSVGHRPCSWTTITYPILFLPFHDDC